MFTVYDFTEKMAECYIKVTDSHCSKCFIQYNISAGILNASTLMVVYAALQFFTFHPFVALQYAATGLALRAWILPEFTKFNMPGLINRVGEYWAPKTGIMALRAFDGYPLFKPFLTWPG